MPTWPFDMDTEDKNPVFTLPAIHPIEQGRRLRVLAPLLSHIATSGNIHYHEIAEGVSRKTEQLIYLANTTQIQTGDTQVTVLSILAGAVKNNNHWAIEGHQEVAGVKKFALTELTVSNLKSL